MVPLCPLVPDRLDFDDFMMEVLKALVGWGYMNFSFAFSSHFWDTHLFQSGIL